jgi:hypothetical protein
MRLQAMSGDREEWESVAHECSTCSSLQ